MVVVAVSQKDDHISFKLGKQIIRQNRYSTFVEFLFPSKRNMDIVGANYIIGGALCCALLVGKDRQKELLKALKYEAFSFIYESSLLTCTLPCPIGLHLQVQR